MILNFGPQHPSAHGQLKLVLELDGEKSCALCQRLALCTVAVEKMAENYDLSGIYTQ